MRYLSNLFLCKKRLLNPKENGTQDLKIITTSGMTSLIRNMGQFGDDFKFALDFLWTNMVNTGCCVFMQKGLAIRKNLLWTLWKWLQKELFYIFYVFAAFERKPSVGAFCHKRAQSISISYPQSEWRHIFKYLWRHITNYLTWTFLWNVWK